MVQGLELGAGDKLLRSKVSGGTAYSVTGQCILSRAGHTPNTTGWVAPAHQKCYTRRFRYLGSKDMRILFTCKER